MMAKENLTDSFMEPDIGLSSESFLRFLESQKELFHSQVDQLQKIVITQCKLTGANPLSQEMAAGALSINIGKRPRDLLNPKAINYMQSVFSIKDTISKKETREISALCGVTVTQVKDFFAGQRSRVRRLVRLSREKAIRFNACKASPDGNITNPDHAMPVSNPVPVDSVEPKNSEEGPSCSSQEENFPGIDDFDKKYLENIFSLMRKEETFSGEVKLMERVLQLNNSAVLQCFMTKGGMTILASWLSQAALEEQTTVLLIIFKVLCHLPLHKALPAQMSAILQIVNRLRFYRTSDISNRARVLLSKWSNLFVRSQALRKPSSTNTQSDAQKERIRKQRISEILSDESWQSKIDIPEEILALICENSENSRKEPKQALKLLLAPGDESNKKHLRNGSSPQTRERRKVLLVEQPGNRTVGRSVQIARAVPANQGRPISADDIQKAKMRAIFMQSKYGKIGTSSIESHQEKTDNQNISSIPKTDNALLLCKIVKQEKKEHQKTVSFPSKASQPLPEALIEDKEAVAIPHKTSQPLPVALIEDKEAVAIPSKTSEPLPEAPIEDKEAVAIPSKTSEPLPEAPIEDEEAVAIPPKTSQPLPEALMDSKPSMVPQEPFWEKLKRDQIPWQLPPEMRISSLWRVGIGEKSKEVEVQTQRIRREKEIFYPSVRDIPSNPKEPWDVEMDFDDTLTPEIPTEQPPDVDGAEASSSRCNSDNSVGPPTATTAPASSGNTEPDLELLAVLLKNPDLVFALTSGQGNNMTSAEMVALLDMLKGSNISLPGILSGLAGNAAEKPEMTSLPSPTPPAEREMRWRSQSTPLPRLSEKQALSQPVLQFNEFSAAVPTPLSSSVLHQNSTTNSSMLRQPIPGRSLPPEKSASVSSTLQQMHPMSMTSLPTQAAAIATYQKQPPSIGPSAHQFLPSNHFPEAVLPTNQFPAASTPPQHVAISGPTLRHVPTANPGLTHSQTQPPPASALLNSTNNRPHASAATPPLPTSARSARPLLPEEPPAFIPTYSPWPRDATSNGGAALASPDSSSTRQRGISDGSSLNQRLQPNLNEYNNALFFSGAMRAQLMPGPHMDKDDFMGEPEFERWSPEGSPVRSPDYRTDRSCMGPRRDFGRSYRHEWPRHRSSGHHHRDHRPANRRWRDRRR